MLSWQQFRARLHGVSWPLGWRWTHRAGWSLAALTVATGVAIVWQPTHGLLIRYLLDLRLLHSVVGFILAAGLGAAAGAFFPRRRNRLDWIAFSVILGVLTVSGVYLLFPQALGPSFSAPALTIHLWATWALVAFVAFHASRKLLLIRMREGPLLSDRRRFLGETARYFLGAAFLAWLGPMFMGSAGASGARTPEEGSWQYYTVTGGFPDIARGRYRLVVDGLVRNAATYSYDDLLRLPRAAFTWNFQCVTGWVVAHVAWEGVALATLMERAGPESGASYAVFHSADGVYVDALSFEDIRRSRPILALTMESRPVTSLHGGPVRLFVPNMFGYKSVKWVNRITFAQERPVGTWEGQGYPAEAWIAPGLPAPRYTPHAPS